jgi:hypothetical protein
MNYDEIRNSIENMAKDNYQDFIKAIISYEKGINDKEALDTLYSQFMENDTVNLLHEEFDYMIDELREQGQIKDIPYQPDKDDIVTLVGNVVGKVEAIERENKNGGKFSVVNFSLLTKDENGEKKYHNCSAYGEKGKLAKDFQRGDFVKISGQLRSSIDDNGKEHTNIRILSTKMLKAREQMQNSEKEKEVLEKEIQSLQEQIEDRQLDLHYADSFEQSGQIREDIQKMEAKLSSIEERLKKTVEKVSEKENKPKDSILGAIKKLKEESTEKQEQKPIKGEMEL